MPVDRLLNRPSRQFFLIDGLGAVLTALLLSHVLARMESVFGMPKDILYLLAAVAGVFAVYSLLCYAFVRDRWRSFLRGIAVANTLYCTITLGLVISRWTSLTGLGITYFLVEIAIVMSLVTMEFKKAAQKS
jgi:cation transport ATPase